MEDIFVGFILNQIQKNMNISEYIVYLATTGGSPFSAINLYNFVKSLPQKTTVYNMSNVSSAGVLFFLGFKNRIGVPDCSFMIHQTTIPNKSIFPEWVNVVDIETQKESLLVTDDNTRVIIEKETKVLAEKPLKAKQIKEAILKSTTFHTEKAKQFGFISEIKRPVLPDKDILYITDQYLATLPG